MTTLSGGSKGFRTSIDPFSPAGKAFVGRPEIKCSGAMTKESRIRWGSTGAEKILLEFLREAGLNLDNRRIIVRQESRRSTHYPPVSAVVMRNTGTARTPSVEMRIKPRNPNGYLYVVDVYPRALEQSTQVLAACAETAKRLYAPPADPAAKPRDPASEETTAAVLEYIEALADQPCGDLEEFAALVAGEAGPDEDPDFWMKALTAAEAKGAVHRSSRRFHLGPPRPAVITVPALPEPLLKAPTPPPVAPSEPQPAPVPAPAAAATAPAKPPAPLPVADPDVAEVFAAKGKTVLEAYQQAAALRKVRAELEAEAASLVERVRRVEQMLVENQKQLDEATAHMPSAADLELLKTAIAFIEGAK